MSAAREVELAENRYGKSRVRLLKVVRRPDGNTIFDWTLELLLEGDFAAVYTDGDNAHLPATDTIKNSVYALARTSTAETVEEFGRELAEFLLGRNPRLLAAQVRVASALWRRLQIHERDDRFSFLRGSQEQQTVTVRHKRHEAPSVTSGFSDMVLLKTSRSGFSGFQRDALTTLPETTDRLLGTAVSAQWTYRDEPVSFAATHDRVREAMLQTFAEHDSKSVQHTLFAMGEAALAAAREIDAIDLRMPNRHYLLVDLARFGQDNPNMIFVPTDEPHGTIEATIRRKQEA